MAERKTTAKPRADKLRHPDTETNPDFVAAAESAATDPPPDRTGAEPLPQTLHPTQEMGREEDLNLTSLPSAKDAREVAFGKNVWLDDKGGIVHVGDAHNHPGFVPAGTVVSLPEKTITEIQDRIAGGPTKPYDMTTDQIAAARAELREREDNEPAEAQTKWAEAVLDREDRVSEDPDFDR